MVLNFAYYKSRGKLLITESKFNLLESELLSFSLATYSCKVNDVPIKKMCMNVLIPGCQGWHRAVSYSGSFFSSVKLSSLWFLLDRLIT